jgi:Ran-binding protein 1
MRCLMRREKTMKICANFTLLPSIGLKENAGSDRSWVWQCADFSEEKNEMSTLAIRFANSESALRHAAPSPPRPTPAPAPPRPAPPAPSSTPRPLPRAPPQLRRASPACAVADALKFKEEFELAQKAMAGIKGDSPAKPAASPAKSDKEAPTEAKSPALD